MCAIEYHVKGSRGRAEHDISRHVVPIAVRKVGNDAQACLWGGVCQLLHALESTIEDKTAIEMGRE